MSTENWNRLTKVTRLVKVFRYSEIPSTNDRAGAYLRRIRKPMTGPVLFAADRQTAGRGRGAHTWWSPDGGLFLSYAARRSDFGISDGESVELSLSAARAVAQTVRRQGSALHPEVFSIQVKPPNDVLLNGRKVCGILIESPSPETVIIGIGVNLNTPSLPIPKELHSRFIAIEMVLGSPLDPLDFVTELTQRLFP
ncbi:MAG: biotin--[acetyl-CoA-carboxylase] ligase [Thermoguttaceae bacterium]|jgi:BirA family biotin operon repressor/biotin-[acetyl-CoA-carboxylase] ligase